MLIRFCVKNFLSFHGQQCLSYSPTADRAFQSRHSVETGSRAIPHLNRSAILFGASASGKTNLLLALRSLSSLICDSSSFSEGEFAERFTPFRFDCSDELPTEFEIDLLIDRIRYSYSIAFNSRRITYERLLVFRAGKAQRWFERRFDARVEREEWAAFSSSLQGARQLWRKSTHSRIPFVVAAAKMGASQFAPLFQWFNSRIEFVLEVTDHAEFELLIARLRDPQFRTMALDVLRAVGVPASDIRVVPSNHVQDPASFRPAGLVSRPPYDKGSATVEFKYMHLGESPVWMTLASEAAGTQRLLSLLRPLFDPATKGNLVVIDNFDASLHPLVSRFLLERTNSAHSGVAPMQLLLTSHNTTLMDLSLLRRDEIWLLGLDDSFASQLACLGRLSLRKSEAVSKHYLAGRYGGVPAINSMAHQ